MDWSELLLPAPSVIGQLGSLLLTASAKDLQLAKDDQLNASKSLLESMILIGGDAFYAFFDAQTGIDNIIRRRFNDVTVSEHIKIVVDMHINGQGNQTLIVRKDLNNIKEMAELHSNQMKTVVKAFKEVYPLIEKLTIASLEQQKFVAEGSAGSEEKLTQTVAQLQALGNYWNQTTNFFQSFAIMVESKWKTKLIDFIDSVENVTKIERNFTKSATNATKSAYDRMYKSAFHATIIDYRINHLAETFVAVSETFFLRMLADVRTLAGVDTDSAAFTNSQQRLDAYIRAAPQQIMRKLVEENDRFNKGCSYYCLWLPIRG
uniref:Apolipoprotein B n=2 Tax=Plectus sambesii TaxID=2011161 RepID=A0A914X7K9_9BILA